MRLVPTLLEIPDFAFSLKRALDGKWAEACLQVFSGPEQIIDFVPFGCCSTNSVQLSHATLALGHLRPRVRTDIFPSVTALVTASLSKHSKQSVEQVLKLGLEFEAHRMIRG